VAIRREPKSRQTNETFLLLPSIVSIAGGYDAIWVLCLTPPTSSTSTSSGTATTPLEHVETLLTSWKEMSVRPLSKNAWVKGAETGVVGSERGLVREKLESVEGLREAVERAKKQEM